MEQTIVNWVLTAAGTVLGFLLNAVWQAVQVGRGNHIMGRIN